MTSPTTGTLRVRIEMNAEGRFNAHHLGHSSASPDGPHSYASRAEALEALRRRIVGACYTAGIVSVESVDLDLGSEVTEP